MRRSLLATTACLALTVGSPALALSPSDVWAIWSPWLEAQGATTASVVDENGGLIVSGIQMTGPDGDTVVPTMHLMPDGDSVVVSWPEPITHAKEGEGRIAVDASGMELRLDDAAVPGVLGRMAGALTGDVRMEMSTSDGAEPLGTASLTGVRVEAGEGDGADGASVSTAFEAMAFAFTLPAPQGGEMDVSGEAGMFQSALSIEGLSALGGPDPIAAIALGTNIYVSGEHGAGSYMLVHPTESSSQSWTDGSFEIALDRAGIAYDVAMAGIAMAGMMPDGMGTFSATATETSFGVAFPLFGQAETQTARMDLRVADLAIDASALAMPEPVKALFKEAMGIEMTATAQVELYRDLFPGSMDDRSESPDTAGRVASVAVENLDVSFAGSTGAASGQMAVLGTTFADMLPGPATGSVALGNIAAAMDALEGAGLVDPSSRTMAEGMLRGFAKPGETDDLTYDLQTEDWVGFSVNGNRF